LAGADKLAIRIVSAREVGREDFEIDAPTTTTATGATATGPRVRFGPHAPTKDLAATRRREPRHKEQKNDNRREGGAAQRRHREGYSKIGATNGTLGNAEKT
jgi:hypothetical protein